MAPKKISCIINPTSANHRWKKHKKLRAYLQQNIPGHIFDSDLDKAGTVQKAKKLSQENDILIAAGGDGTVADVIQGIIEANREKHTTLAVLPIGSGNAFRKSLGIPLNLKKSLQLIENGHQKKIDLIDIDGRMATFGSIGATGQITYEKERGTPSGLTGHLRAGLSLLYKLPQKKYDVELFDGLDSDGLPFKSKSLSINAIDCIIAKTNYFGYSWKIAPLAVADDGYIDITFLEMTPTQVLLSSPLIYSGKSQKRRTHLKAKKAVVRGRDLFVQYHGDFLGKKDEITLTVRPRSLAVLVP